MICKKSAATHRYGSLILLKSLMSILVILGTSHIYLKYRGRELKYNFLVSIETSKPFCFLNRANSMRHSPGSQQEVLSSGPFACLLFMCTWTAHLLWLEFVSEGLGSLCSLDNSLPL